MKKSNEEIKKILEDLGGNYWEKGSYKRVYFNPKKFGLEVKFYATGNIARAKLDGGHVSNIGARNILSAKFFYDFNTGEIGTKGSSHYAVDMMKESIEAKVARALEDKSLIAKETDNSEAIEAKVARALEA